MRAFIKAIGFIILGLIPSVVWASNPPALTPMPARVSVTEGQFAITEHTVVYVPQGDAEAQKSAQYFAYLVKKARGFSLTIKDGAPQPSEKAILFQPIQTLVATPKGAYDLNVTSDRITIQSGNATGLFYGGITLWQLMTQEAGQGPVSIGGIAISDTPRFQWRGLMIDSARHFQTVDEIKKTIDVMATLKLNVFHWHLVDDQAWRLEIKAYPKLTEVASKRVPAGAMGRDPKTGAPVFYGAFYTQDQVRDIVAYAAERHIMIVPEIEMPGHATAPITAYPEFGTTGKAPETGMSDWGIYPNLYGVEDNTFEFLTTAIDEVMTLFPGDYIHVGGDEAIKPQWEESPAVQAKIKALGIKDAHHLQSWFITRIGEHIAKRGRKMIGWDEILEGGLAPSAAVMSWRGIEGAVEAAKLGHDTVLSPYPYLYFDNRQSASHDEPPGRGFVVTLKDVYAFNPIPEGISPENQSHILGYQGNVWTEHIRTDERFELMAFPRIVAVAEGAWTPQSGRSWERFSNALPATLNRLSVMGIGYNRTPFTPQATLKVTAYPKRWGQKGTVEVSLANAMELGELWYSLNGQKARYSGPFTAPVGAKLVAYTMVGNTRVGDEKTIDLSIKSALTRTSYQLDQCGNALPLGLEDDYGAAPRPKVYIDVMHPCWLWKGFEPKAHEISVTVANIPFNYQLADGIKAVKIPVSETPEGELLVRDGCDGEILAQWPLKEAAKSDGLTTFKGKLKRTPSSGDLCFSFRQPKFDPIWAVERVIVTGWE